MLDEDVLKEELKELGLSGPTTRITNPWYYRAKGTGKWIKVGESEDKTENFAVQRDTRTLKNGKYEMLGLMHVFVNKGDVEHAIARQSVVEVTIRN